MDWCEVLSSGYGQGASCFTYPLQAMMGAFMTRDGGECWAKASQPAPGVGRAPDQRLAAWIDAPEPALLYVGFDGALYRSVDAGGTFTRSEFANNHNLIAISVHPKSGRVYAVDGRSHRLLRSDDGGATASTGNNLYIENLLSPSPRTVAVSPLDPDIVLVGGKWGYAGTGSSAEHVLARSTDGGATFGFVTVSPTNKSAVVTHVEFAPSDPMRVYASTSGDGFYRSEDAGLMWTRVSDNRVRTFRVHPRDEDSLWGLSGTMSSTDGGVTWTDWVSGSAGMSLLQLVCSDNQDEPCRQWGLLRLASSDEGFSRLFTRPEGDSWREVMAGLPAVSSLSFQFGPALLVQSPSQPDTAVVVYLGWQSIVF